MKKLFTLVLIFTSLYAIAQPESEPNNTFESANSINAANTRTGSVDNRTLNGVKVDEYDYFRAVFPTDGTLNINISGTNNHTGGGYLYMYGYDRRKGAGQVTAKYIGNKSNVLPGESVNDIITLYGRAADTFYFRLETSGFFNYSISYNLTDITPNDQEPNNAFDQSIPINKLETKAGHIGYAKNGGTDNDDFYRAILPDDGTLKIIVEGTNYSGITAYLYLYTYDRRKGDGQIMAKYLSNSSNISADSTIYDTIYLYGRAADTMYFRIASAGAFSYNLKYDVTNTSTNDSEPNNDFNASINIDRGEVKKGHIGYVKNGTADNDDYYRTVFPYDGTLKILVEGTNNSGGNGYLYMYGYDRRKGNGQVMAKYISNNSNISANTTIYDTIYIHGRAADSFYFRLSSAGAFSYTFHYDITDTTVNDTEPNNSFEEPVAIAQLQEKKGHIGYIKNGADDASDYYKTVVPIDGTLKIYIQGTNRSGGTGYMYLYGYDRRKGNGQVFATYVSGISNVGDGATIYDTITVYGVLADTFYLRVTSAGAFNYQLSYNTIVNSEFDPEPNNTIDESVAIRQGVLQNGQIGYTLGGNRDNYDYYVTNFPADGTMKLIIQGTNNGGGSGYLYMYGFDKRRGNGQVLGKYAGNVSNVSAGATIYDTIYLYGRASDTFYYRIESAQPFSYKFSYDIVDTSENDIEPNNTFEQSVPITFLEEKKGHIGYVKAGTSDEGDYYRAILPQDGTLKVVVNGTNKSGGSGYLYLYGYDNRQANGQILAKYIGNNSNVAANASISDTIYLYGRAADTVYFRITSAGAFNYSLKYDLTDTSANDIEPNNTIEQSVAINIMQEKKGHISYTSGGSTDNDDFYRTILPADGTLKIMIQGRNRSGGNGYIYLYGYDKRSGNGQILAKYISNSSNIKADSTIYDTIYLYGRAADTAYFRVTAAGAWSYSIKYDLLDSSDNDIEPNNSFEQSIYINAAEQKKGHIGYQQSGVGDASDFYVTKLPADGTLRILMEGINRSGNSGYIYLNVYDKRKGNGQIFAKYIDNNSNVQAGAAIKDTILLPCRAVDSIYFSVTSAGAFAYTLSYNMQNVSANDEEPNNSLETAPSIKLDTLYNGHIGYLQNGVPDNDDFYKIQLPEKGNVKIIVAAKNTSGNPGYQYLYVYDRRQVLIFQKYIGNNSNVAAGAAIFDTITINCVTTDTMYLRLTSAGCFSYNLKTQLQSLQPKADFDYTRVGNTFGFQINPNSNGNSFSWDLGNGSNTTNTVPPLVSYTPGFYTAKLIARNNAGSCLFTDTAKQSFTIKGIERYTPAYSGPGNVYFTLYGGGLDTNVVVKLKKGSMEFVDSFTSVNKFGNIYNCLLDLHSAPAGLYDVVVTAKDSTYYYPNGFRVDTLIDKLRVEIVGNQNIRVNTDNVFIVRVHNEGNTFTGISKVYLLTAPNVNVTELDSLIPVTATQYVDPNTLPHVLEVTTADGFPITGNIRGFYIYGIPAGAYRDIKFTFKFQAGVSDVYVWSSGPISGSPDRPGAADCWKARANLAYQSVNYPLDLIPVVDCAWNLVKLGVSSLYNLGSAFFGSFSDGYDATGAMASYAKTGAKAAKNCAGEAGVPLTGPGAIAIETADIGTDILSNTLSTQQAYYDWLEKCNDEPKDKDKKKTDARTSWDPNAKTGPSGIGAKRYINGSEKLLTYGIFFENLPAATLPAQNVTIYDTLDKNVYDLLSFNVESFAIGTNFYNFSPDQDQYVANVNISPTLALRVNLKLDTATGVLTATFKTLDRSTGDTTTDQLAGFLPPNKTSPEGQGFITYSLNMKEGMPDGTQLKNKATIIFDTNDPIVTDTWINTLDTRPPSSTIARLAALSDTSATININGTDATSGVEYYMLYSSENGGPYKKVGHVRSPLTFYGRPGAMYNFYTRAVDSVGNIETKSPQAEGSITFGGVLAIVTDNITATNVGNRHRIDFATATEDRGDRFEIQKSADGRNFSRLTMITARGYAGGYTVYDEHPAEGRTYYRLKTLDKDGSSKIGKIVSAYLLHSGTVMLEAYPNPVNDKLTLNIHGSRDGNASVKMVNVMGTLVYQTDITRNQLAIDMSKYAPGVYYIQYSDSKNNSIIKITKL